MLYILNKRFQLRGWDKLPFALCDTVTGFTLFMRKEDFMLICHCDGKHDINEEELTERGREILKEGISKKIITPCPEGGRLEKHQEYHKYDSRYIKSAQWSITGKCNFRCRHCFMSAPHAKLGELSYEECLRIIEEMGKCGIRSVSLTGGEPLIRKDFFDIVDELIRHNIIVESIYSNGKLVTDDFLDKLEERGLKPTIHMSFDGVGWHDWLRGIEGAEKMVTDAYRRCQERNFDTTCEMCVHKNNIGSFRETMLLLSELGCRSLKVNAAAPMGEWTKTSSEFTLSLKETYDVFLDYIRIFYEEGMPINLWLGGFFKCDRGETGYRIGNCKYAEGYDCSQKSVCGHARNSLYISPEGYALPCMTIANTKMKEDFPNILRTDLSDILTDSTYMSLVDLRLEDYLAHNEKCQNCEFKNRCGAGCRGVAIGETGSDYLMPDEEVCFFFHSGYDKKVREVADEAAAKVKQKQNSIGEKP